MQEVEAIKWNLAALHNLIESKVKRQISASKEIEQFCKLHKALDDLYNERGESITSVENILQLPPLQHKDKQIFDTMVYLARKERERKQAAGEIYPEVNF